MLLLSRSPNVLGYCNPAVKIDYQSLRFSESLEGDTDLEALLASEHRNNYVS